MIVVLFSLGLMMGAGALFLIISGLAGRELDVNIGAGFLLGTSIFTVAMIILSGAGVAWSPVTVVSASLLLCSSAFLFRRIPSAPARAPAGDQDRRYSVADGLLVLVLIAHALYVTESAPRHWDYWAIWGLKAKVFTAAGGTIDWSFLGDQSNRFSHPDYPPLLTMTYSWLGCWGEVWNDRWFGLVDTAFLGAFLLTTRRVTARLFGSVTTGSWTALLIAFPAMQGLIGYADLPLYAFVTSGLLFLQEHLRRQDLRDAIIGFLLLGGGALTKNEGLAFFFVALAISSLLSARRVQTVTAALPGLAILMLWQIPKAFLGLSTDVASGGWASRFAERAGEPVWLGDLVRLLPPGAIAALIGIGGALLLARSRLRHGNLIVIAAAIQLLIYLTVYAGTPNDLTWHIRTSWDRISLHLAVPLLAASLPVLIEVFRGSQEHGRGHQLSRLE